MHSHPTLRRVGIVVALCRSVLAASCTDDADWSAAAEPVSAIWQDLAATLTPEHVPAA